MTDGIRIRHRAARSDGRIPTLLAELWGGPTVISRGRMHEVADLPAYVALRGESIIGILSYWDEGGTREIVTLNSLEQSAGVGSLLIRECLEDASLRSLSRVWLVTTNDNLTALRFYQRRGFRLAAIHQDAITLARVQKPSIPLIGEFGIPLRDEVELEIAV